MPIAIFLWGNIFKLQKELMLLKDKRGVYILQVDCYSDFIVLRVPIKFFKSVKISLYFVLEFYIF
jgi:hypothetical protein